VINIAIVDDKAINRRTVVTNLQQHKEINILFEANNGKDFLQKMEALVDNPKPDIVLMDIDMPVMNGIEAVALGTIKHPGVKFLMLTVFDDDDKLFQAIQAGACGYLLKDDSADMLHEAVVDAVENNGAPMSPAIARKTLQWMRSAPAPSDTESAITLLSERETEILLLMVQGLNYKKIAEKLFISPLTVRTHTSKIYDKLHVNSKAQAIQLAHKYNWV
jgi:DNA-binding NarL/FixJ family response regulator